MCVCAGMGGNIISNRYLGRQAYGADCEWAVERVLHPCFPSPTPCTSGKGGARPRRQKYVEGARLPDVLQQIRLPLLPGLKDAQLLQEAKLHLLGRLHLKG